MCICRDRELPFYGHVCMTLFFYLTTLSVRSSAAPLASPWGRRLRGPKRIKKWTWMRLWLIILINSRNSFGVGPRGSEVVAACNPRKRQKVAFKALSGYVMDKWSPWTLTFGPRENYIGVQLWIPSDYCTVNFSEHIQPLLHALLKPFQKELRSSMFSGDQSFLLSH